MTCVKMTWTRCTCDHCGKKNWSKGLMRKHEMHCTKNPNRECRVCKMVEGEQKPIAELLALLPETASWEDEYGFVVYHEDTTKNVNAALPLLRDACEGCPACILSALRQKGIPVPLATDFDFTKEMKSLWNDICSSRLDTEY